MDHKDKYYNISHSQLSIARMYGGCKINGKMYIYNPVEDSLTLESLVKKKPKTKKELKEIKKKYKQFKLEL